MSRASIRWIFYLVAVFVVGPLAGMLVASLHGLDGSTHTTLLVNASIPKGILVGVVVLAAATAMGAGCAFITDARSGMVTTGLVLVWAAWRGGQVDEILRTAGGSGNAKSALYPMAVEGAVLGAAAVLATVLIMRVARRNPDQTASPSGPTTNGIVAMLKKAITGEGVAISVITTVAVTAGIAWWLVFSEYKGQVLLGAAVAIFLGVAAGRVAGNQPPPQACMIAVGLLAALSPAAAAIAQGSDILATTYAGSLFPIARLAPLDWIAAGFLGAPVGLTWASSIIEKHGS
jgi:hypothetical protein